MDSRECPGCAERDRKLRRLTERLARAERRALRWRWVAEQIHKAAQG